MTRLAYLISFVLLLSCGSGENTKSHDSSENTEAKKVLKLSDLEFSDLDGNTFTGEKYQGKPVFMNIWATWCGPCIKEMPGIKKAIEKTKGVTFIFPSDEDLKDIKKFKSSKKYDFEFLQMKTGLGKIGVSTLPTTLLFDSKGEIIEAIIGAEDWNSPEALAYLDSLSHK